MEKKSNSYHSVEFVVQISHCLGEEKRNLLQMSTACQIEHHPFVPRPVHIRCT